MSELITHGFLYAEYDKLMSFAAEHFPSDEGEAFSVPVQFATHPRKASRAQRFAGLDEEGNEQYELDPDNPYCILAFTLLEAGASLIDVFSEVGEVHVEVSKQWMEKQYPGFRNINHYYDQNF